MVGWGVVGVGGWLVDWEVGLVGFPQKKWDIKILVCLFGLVWFGLVWFGLVLFVCLFV